MVVPVDRVRRYIKNGSYGDAQRRVEELLPMHPSSPELHDVLLELVDARSDLKGWAERLLAQIQDDTGTVSATLARLRGATPPPPVGDPGVVEPPPKVIEWPVDPPAPSPDEPVGPAPARELPEPVDQRAVQPPPVVPVRDPQQLPPNPGPTPSPSPTPGPKPTVDPSERTFYQRGRDAMDKNPPDLKEAIRWLELVPDTDPDSATARTQLDALKNQLIPQVLLARINYPQWKSATNSRLEKRVIAIYEEITKLSQAIVEGGALVPDQMVGYQIRAQELSDQWDLTHKLEESIKRGLYHQALAQLNQVVAVGPFEPAERHRAQLVAVRKAEEDLRQFITRANPKTTDLQTVIESYEGLVSNLSPDTTLLDDQVTNLVSTAKRKLQDLIQQRFEQAKEEFDASEKRSKTLRNVIERLDSADDILDVQVIRLDPNHADALMLQRKVKSRLAAALTLDQEMKAFPAPGTSTYSTAEVDGVVKSLGNLADENLDDLNDAVKFRSQVIDYCVKRAEDFVTGVAGGNSTNQIENAEAWLKRAESATATSPSSPRPPEVDGLRRQIEARRQRLVWEKRWNTWGRPLAGAGAFLTVAIVVLLIFPATRNAAIESYSAACDEGWPACPKYLPIIVEKNPNTPNCDFSAVTSISVCDTNTAPFRDYWKKNPLLGEPIMPARFQDGAYIQDFVGGRITLNPGNKDRPVLMSLIGDTRIKEVDEAQPYRQRTTGYGECFVNEHNMPKAICDFYQNNGAQDYFGFPISESYKVGGWEVQWFQRGRLESDANGVVRIAPVTCEILEDKRRRQRVNCPVPR